MRIKWNIRFVAISLGSNFTRHNNKKVELLENENTFILRLYRRSEQKSPHVHSIKLFQ